MLAPGAQHFSQQTRCITGHHATIAQLSLVILPPAEEIAEAGDLHERQKGFGKLKKSRILMNFKWISMILFKGFF